jgi:hypothetical protein
MNEAGVNYYLSLTKEEKQLNTNAVKKMFPSWSIKMKDINDDAIRYYCKNGKDNCVNYSFDTWIRLYKIGSKRVRADVKNASFTHNPDNNKIVFHYWCETDKYVFNENAFSTMIIPREEYYTFYKIINIEIAENGIFKTYNKKLKIGRDNDEMLLKYTTFLKTQK